jgi:hypothetical protein
MTKKSFRREINLLSHKKPKKKVLEMFAAVLSEERAKTGKKKKAASKAKKRKQREVATSSSESSSDEEEIHTIDTFAPRLKAQRLKKRIVTSENSDSNDSTLESNESPEEKAYKTSIQDLGKTRDGDGSAETPIMTN